VKEEEEGVRCVEEDRVTTPTKLRMVASPVAADVGACAGIVVHCKS